MKRYLVFAGEVFYPFGGMEDFKRDFDCFRDALHYVNDNLQSNEWVQIYDTTIREIIWPIEEKK